jgi:thiamine-monophosphate kinase
MATNNYPSGEYKLLNSLGKILGRAAATGKPYPLTLGDDAAIRLCSRNERLVFTADIAVENVHFTTDSMSFEEIGFRSMAANVSDCAAMASLPEAALVQLVFPSGERTLQSKCEALYRGFGRACRKWRFRLIGGDLSGGPCWTIGITLIGRAPDGGRPLTRTGIHNKDSLWLTGFPGLSAAGFAAIECYGRKKLPKRFQGLSNAHIIPDPPVGLGILLGACADVHAMMDLSDGISKDAATLCHENRLGLELSLENLRPPLSLIALGEKLGTRWQEWALHGGEEYELLFAAGEGFDPESLPGTAGKEMIRLGSFTNKFKGIKIREGKRVRRVEGKSWDHTIAPQSRVSDTPLPAEGGGDVCLLQTPSPSRNAHLR